MTPTTPPTSPPIAPPAGPPAWGPPAPEAEQAGHATPGRNAWLTAVLRAIALQLAAFGVMLLNFFVLLLAAFEVWATDDPEPAWTVVAWPIAGVAICLYLWSGAVAARIVGSAKGWFVLLITPAAGVTLALLAAVT